MSPADILIIDDEADIRSLIRGILEDEGYAVREAGNDKQAYEVVAEKKPDLIILDIWLHNSADDGLKILETIKESYPLLPILMISGHGTIETAVSAIKQGAYDFIEKPFKSDRLLLMIERALETAQLKTENENLKRQQRVSDDSFIGSSSIISAIRQSAEKVAQTNSRVLITGQPGTGKEILARFIHGASDRADRPYHAINCAILRPDSLERELFGIEKDPDTGKVHQGVLEQIDGGTLLLDEVADMPLETQGKILRVLQEQKFQRVGGTSEIEVDVRIIASTNKDLEQAINTEKFRKDLYYRLSVVPIEMPPLYKISDDVPALTEYFIVRFAEQSGLNPCKFSSDVMDILKSYKWPGNIRQLKNVVEWLMIMQGSNGNDVVSVKDLPPEIAGKSSAELVNLNSNAPVQSNSFSVPLREAREIFEKDYLTSQIERFDGNISKTAEFVGMERSALHRKLKQLGIQNGSSPKHQADTAEKSSNDDRKSA